MSQFLPDGTASGSLEDMLSFFDEFCDAFGLGYLTYYAVDAPMLESGSLLLTNYPESWKANYFTRNYQAIDPVLKTARHRLTPMDWSELPSRKGSTERFFLDARNHGIGNFGMTVPVRGQYGELALVSVNAETSSTEWASRWHGTLPDYTFFAYQLHTRIIRAVGAGSTPAPQLTRREAEVMQWAIRGKSAWDTATLMGLSERTVHFYVRNVCSKLGVSTKTQAVARVVREHLITF
ncbi:LuxR family transcriptional regulator [Cereibacter sphaeroides]|uniref:LuxR family transcriptional regulator n=1 Tax=Cereibacter sphaeroides TaxID=1063 RepID=UPI001F377535|nr:LuxR family transcriptional regulator [Cereibacter sphaeroides]MCE6958340.1 LuxR family transcriptional regulator [Cereibacter sphaeroides]MCE6972207.1 LuxR family transcriptional regulator [Cereibacter sphaeroides]